MDVKSTLRTTPQARDNRFMDYLLGTTLEPELHQPCLKPLLTVQTTDSLPYVFRRLSNEGILSAPVLEGTWFRGFITLFDITNYVTNMYWGNDGEEWQTFFTNSEDWNDSTVDDIMETPVWRGRQNVDPLYTYNTTFHALEKLAVTRAHRAVVLNQDTNRVVNIMTQSMLISEIKQRIFMLPNGLRNKLVRNMTEFFTTCKTINENDKAMNAFIQMRDSNVNGLAIVNDDGELTNAISIRDLRGIGVDGPFFSRLFRTVKDFKATVAREYPKLGSRAHYYIGNTPVTGRCVSPEDTFEDVINKMADGCIHRIFVCSSQSIRSGRPIPENVLTQTNILSQVLRFFAMPAGSWEVAGRG